MRGPGFDSSLQLQVSPLVTVVVARTHAGVAELNGVSQLVLTPDGVWAADQAA